MKPSGNYGKNSLKKITDPKKMQALMEKERRRGKSVGFVPTMGALHEGHLSLVRRARRENQIVVASIFVNPLQFGPKEDFKKYPRTFAADREMLAAEKVDYLFSPTVKNFYAGDFSTSIKTERLAERLCGQFRPGHFEGVVTVVAKLFNLVRPTHAYFGAKDYQQAVVIRRMNRDLNFGCKVRILPTVREKNGLAMSSRNRYLNAGERKRAAEISQTLFWVRDQIASGKRNIPALRRQAARRLRHFVDGIQYFEIVDPENLKPLGRYQPRMVVLTACFVGKTRLIDNVIMRFSNRN